MAKLRLKNGQEVNLKLRENDDGSVTVIAVNECGNPIAGGCLVKFKTSGYIYREPYVTDTLGFRLNDAGKLRLARHHW